MFVSSDKWIISLVHIIMPAIVFIKQNRPLSCCSRPCQIPYTHNDTDSYSHLITRNQTSFPSSLGVVTLLRMEENKWPHNDNSLYLVHGAAVLFLSVQVNVNRDLCCNQTEAQRVDSLVSSMSEEKTAQCHLQSMEPHRNGHKMIKVNGGLKFRLM